MVRVIWPRPFQGKFAIPGLALATIKLSTNFEVSISTYYEDTKGDNKIAKMGCFWVVRGHSRSLEIAVVHNPWNGCPKWHPWRFKKYLFANLSHHRHLFSFRTDSTDCYLDRFLLSCVGFIFLHYLSVLVPCWHLLATRQLLGAY